MSKKRIVLCTCGSLGDLYPFLALARELRDRGHVPVIATAPVYRRKVEDEGLCFHPVRPNIDLEDSTILRRAMDRRTGGQYIICELLFPALRGAYEDTAAAAPGADLLVTHPLTLAAFVFARKSGIPWVSAALAPTSLYSAHDPSVLSALPFAEKIALLPPSLQRGLLQLLAFLFEPQWKPFRKFEQELGLPPAPNPMFWGHSPRLTLGLFSPLLAPPQPDWPANAHATGFPFFSHNQGNSVELQRFLDCGEPPIVFTLGSAAVGVAGDFFEHSADAARRLARRAVLLVGRDPRNQPKRELPPGVIAVPYAPHSAVFPQASVIVHQGGVGTAGEAMRAGRPMLVVPYSHDQPDHAARLTRLGVARTVRQEHYNSAIAAREIQALLEDRKYANRAAEVAARVGHENGVATACDLLGRVLAQSRSKKQNLKREEEIECKC
jgi:rhamnosyltransferase subunit B